MDYITAYYRSGILDQSSNCLPTRIFIKQIKYRGKSVCLLLNGNVKPGEINQRAVVGKDLLTWFEKQDWGKAFSNRAQFCEKFKREIRKNLESENVSCTMLLALEEYVFILGNKQNLFGVADFLGRGQVKALSCGCGAELVQLQQGAVLLLADVKNLRDKDFIAMGNVLKSQVINTEEQAMRHLKEICNPEMGDVIMLLTK